MRAEIISSDNKQEFLCDLNNYLANIRPENLVSVSYSSFVRESGICYKYEYSAIIITK